MLSSFIIGEWETEEHLLLDCPYLDLMRPDFNVDFSLGLPSFMVTDDGKVVSSYVSHVWRWWAQGNPFDVVAYLHLGIMAFGAL